MKIARLFAPLLLLVLTSCSSVRVATDYDTKADFDSYKTFAFYKTGIDKAPISDLDKKRIMRAVEAELVAKGMTKSSEPDVLVSLFTKSRERININDNNPGWGWGYGWGWNPWMWGGANRLNVNQYTEGTLFLDIIDAKKKELVWQGIGTGALKSLNVEKKEARIKEFVKEIMAKYPPGAEKK
ncbi:DUF4136 domain-containing protein [Tenacibaculum sp. IB213877]|uniref:DUF4136 domain-containing protein n=1 Tax=Tenacibaculum sp. IB213877 TaxID=3097351 RepID=UPI002A5A2BE9|nr:DUF4136 domain-containing protein [Tenacibaculum sp. IB213877]MDY0780159.1 DUF4136 domain-containing protein [Tenacibaculum sp. IB213877]